MLQAIAVGNTRSLEQFVFSDEISAGERIGIYRNTTINTLVKALRLAYPAVHRLVGGKFFEGAVQIFLARDWPSSALLDEFGSGLGSFLDSFEAAAPLVYLADVARLEWAVHQALHAADAATLDPSRLAAVPQAQVDGLRLFPHPSLAFVPVQWPADEIWRAVIEEDDAALGAVAVEQEKRWLIVQRSDRAGVHVQSLCEAHWRFASALCAGACLGEAIASTPRDALQPGMDEVLGQLLAAGRFTRFARGTDAE